MVMGKNGHRKDESGRENRMERMNAMQNKRSDEKASITIALQQIQVKIVRWCIVFICRLDKERRFL